MQSWAKGFFRRDLRARFGRVRTVWSVATMERQRLHEKRVAEARPRDLRPDPASPDPKDSGTGASDSSGGRARVG